jgi:hypothetical protein
MEVEQGFGGVVQPVAGGRCGITSEVLDEVLATYRILDGEVVRVRLHEFQPG